jgi:hypothetical protein
MSLVVHGVGAWPKTRSDLVPRLVGPLMSPLSSVDPGDWAQRACQEKLVPSDHHSRISSGSAAHSWFRCWQTMRRSWLDRRTAEPNLHLRRSACELSPESPSPTRNRLPPRKHTASLPDLLSNRRAPQRGKSAGEMGFDKRPMSVSEDASLRLGPYHAGSVHTA